MLIRCAVCYPRLLTLSNLSHIRMLQLCSSNPLLLVTHIWYHPCTLIIFTRAYTATGLCEMEYPSHLSNHNFICCHSFCLVPTFFYILYCFRRSLNTAPFWSYISTVFQLTFELENMTFQYSVASSLVSYGGKGLRRSLADLGIALL